MDAAEVARGVARDVHEAAVKQGRDPWRPFDFVLDASERIGLDVFAVPPDDPQLKGGQAVYDSQARAVLYSDGGSEFDHAFLIAHELGHVLVEGGQEDVVTQHVEPDRAAEDSPVGAERVVDYGVKERREIVMDLFARELLLPRAVAVRLHIDEDMGAKAISDRLGAPVSMVQQQLLDGLLLPQAGPGDSRTSDQAENRIDDPSQTEAARHVGSAFLLQAGPGTGKTRTLVQRVEFLLSSGVSPSEILVLTFSNKAANELNERIAATDRSAAAAMWIGTFHSFGLDVIRRFHERLDLPNDPRIIDRTEAIELLEDEFPRLPLKHYRNLWDPTSDLGDILSAISRAQDEVVDAEGYCALAARMKKGASNVDPSQAEKCAEVGLVFRAYERMKRQEKVVDFGDLIILPTLLAEKDTEVRAALRNRHRHILVDEYQDVNRGSVRLLKAIAAEGDNLWVVGDARQSIYRFRGASSINVAGFGKEFPGAKTGQLNINYRSRREIVDLFSEFSHSMEASKGTIPLSLTASRGAGSEPPELRIADTADDEISAIAASIEKRKRSGSSYFDQAVLCASNSRLNQIAMGLEERGIPVLHLGRLFERSEIKFLLALISLLDERNPAGLVRVAKQLEFSMPLQDVADILHAAKEPKVDPINWIKLAKEVPTLAEESKRSLERISRTFKGLDRFASAWSILADLVIDRLGTAKSIFEASNLGARMHGLALWQFMNFCRRQPSGAGIPTTRLLDRIRRLVLLSEDRGLHQPPKVAGSIDAVRLLTIHGSKGLEFDHVHVPGLVAAGIPRNNIPPRCLPPDGMIFSHRGLTGAQAIKAGHDQEEECLFFVAQSRARNTLQLYAHRKRSDGRTRNLSRFVSRLGDRLEQVNSPTLMRGQLGSVDALAVEWKRKARWSDDQINLFERCPRRFFYTHVLKVSGRRTGTPYLQMHSVVFGVMDWLSAEHSQTHPTQDEVDAKFTENWNEKGAVDHGFSEDYLKIAHKLVLFLTKIRRSKNLTEVQPITLSLPDCDIVVLPDSVGKDDRGRIVVQRVKTGKLKSSPFDDIEFTILRLAADEAYGSEAECEVVHLTSETQTPMSLSAVKLASRRSKIATIATQIRSGDFPLKENARICPSCPSYYICGGLPEGRLVIKN